MRVTFAERQATLPAASLARIVIVFVPISKGIGGVFQVVVPVAMPEPPVELLHVTEATPTLSDAVPEKTMVAEEAATLVPDGDRIARLGAVVSLLGGSGMKVTTMFRTAVPPLFPYAVTVTTFCPASNTTGPALQAVVPVAVPLLPRELAQETRSMPAESDAVPEIAIVPAPVL